MSDGDVDVPEGVGGELRYAAEGWVVVLGCLGRTAEGSRDVGVGGRKLRLQSGRCGVEFRREKFPLSESFERRRDSGASGSTGSYWSKVSAEWGHPSACTGSI